MSVRRSLVLLFLPLSALPGVARGSDPAEQAQDLFDEGKQLMAQGRYSDACPKFEASQKLDAGMGTEFHLADCWQHLGRMASARGLFREVESHAHALGQVGRERVAHDRGAALEPWLSKIAIEPGAAAATPGLEIRRDAIVVAREKWDVPVPVDPGTHVITATAPHKHLWKETVEVPPSGKVVTVEIPPLPDIAGSAGVAQGQPLTPSATAAAAPLAPPNAGVTSSMPPSSEPAPPTFAESPPIMDNRGSAQRAAGWFLVGAGVVSIGAGAFFGYHWLDERNSSNTHCVVNVCDPEGLSLRNDARLQRAYAAAALAGGGGAVLLGSALVLWAPRPRVLVAAPGLQIAPFVGRSEGGAAVRGAW